MSTVGFFASSSAIWPPGRYSIMRARTRPSIESSFSRSRPAASADSRKPPGVTYLRRSTAA